MLLFKKSLPFYSIVFTLFIFTSCQQDSLEPLDTTTSSIPEERTFPGVDERLWPYFERFEAAGQSLGFDVDLVAAGITGEIEDLEGEHIAGQCTTFGSFRPGNVTIDAEFWEIAGDLFKEFIVFHELGHCYLDRGHREDAFTNGRCVSIMRSGTLDCRDNYTPTTRSAYVSELFEPESLDLN